MDLMLSQQEVFQNALRLSLMNLRWQKKFQNYVIQTLLFTVVGIK